MKITKNYLRELIKKEMEISSFSDYGEIREVLDESILDVDGYMTECFEAVKDHTLLSEAEKNLEELKGITSEIKRMKNLVDFRRPLLSSEEF